jgi:hypothetical protein
VHRHNAATGVGRDAEGAVAGDRAAKAREEGAGSLTLARLADACGVSKPIAYQHFGSLTGLLAAMLQRVGFQPPAMVVCFFCIGCSSAYRTRSRKRESPTAASSSWLVTGAETLAFMSGSMET